MLMPSRQADYRPERALYAPVSQQPTVISLRLLLHLFLEGYAPDEMSSMAAIAIAAAHDVCR